MTTGRRRVDAALFHPTRGGARGYAVSRVTPGGPGLAGEASAGLLGGRLLGRRLLLRCALLGGLRLRPGGGLLGSAIGLRAVVGVLAACGLGGVDAALQGR